MYKMQWEIEPVRKEEIIQLLEPLTKKYFNSFSRCISCHSVFWEGSHFDRMTSFINSIQNPDSKLGFNS